MDRFGVLHPIYGLARVLKLVVRNDASVLVEACRIDAAD
jgi:hypothetical protein